jgi:hypothetical protein
MPSCQLFVQSGGIALVSGDIFSGNPIVGGVQLKLAAGAPSLFYVGLPNLSGTVSTSVSGGILSSGGLADGMEISPGDTYFIPKTRLVSGIESIRLIVPTAASGGRLFWENL